MEKKIKKMLILLGILLCILVLGWIGYYLKNRDVIEAKQNLKYINDSNQWNREEVRYPERASSIKNVYEGELTIKDIGKSMYYFTTEVIPKYYNELKGADENAILEYYAKNSEIIAIDTGIDNEEDFGNLIQMIQKLNSENLTLDSFIIDKNKTKAKSSYTETILYITYKDNEEIGFRIKIYNQIKKDASTLIYSRL